MDNMLLHIFRNSPMGRENLMQSAYFCAQEFGLKLAVYIPEAMQFTMAFASGSVPVDLDRSYVQRPERARERVEAALAEFAVQYEFVTPTERAADNSPLLPTDWSVMTCPRVISEQSSRIGLGHIGPKVRGLVKHAEFPVFIPSMNLKAWRSIAIFFGGSALGATVVREGIALARLSRVPFTVYTQLAGVTRAECEARLAEAEVLDQLGRTDADWICFEDESFEDSLYAVPHDALVVVGAAGHRLMQELIFGSKLELIQATLPNPLVVVGPNCRTPFDREEGNRQ